MNGGGAVWAPWFGLLLLMDSRLLEGDVVCGHGMVYALPFCSLFGDIREGRGREAETFIFEEVVHASPNDAEDKQVLSGESF